jgi:hypothetical protein
MKSRWQSLFASETDHLFALVLILSLNKNNFKFQIDHEIQSLIYFGNWLNYLHGLLTRRITLGSVSLIYFSFIIAKLKLDISIEFL